MRLGEQVVLQGLAVFVQRGRGTVQAVAVHRLEVIADQLTQGRALLMPCGRGQPAAGMRHAANDVAQDGSDLHPPQAQLSELVLRAALAHRPEGRVLYAHAALAHQLEGAEIDLLVSAKLTRIRLDGGGPRDACRRGLERDQLRHIALRQRLARIRQRCIEQGALAAQQLIDVLGQRDPLISGQIEMAAQVEQRGLPDGATDPCGVQLLADRLGRLADVTVGAINHPQSNLTDLYRELGDVFAVPRATKGPLVALVHEGAPRGPGPHNRWGGFKSLRERRVAHLETTRRRAVLRVDEAQEMSPAALCELRLLSSACFDSQPLLCVVLAADARLIEKLRREELIPLGSRIRTRLATEHASREELLAGLNHLLAGAGNASLMTPTLRHTLCDHAAVNYRILTTMAAELLAAAAQRELPQLDEKLYLEVFAQPEAPTPHRAAGRR